MHGKLENSKAFFFFILDWQSDLDKRCSLKEGYLHIKNATCLLRFMTDKRPLKTYKRVATTLNETNTLAHTHMHQLMEIIIWIITLHDHQN